MEASFAEILRQATNRDDAGLKASLDRFVKQHADNLQDLVNRILSEEFSSQV